MIRIGVVGMKSPERGLLKHPALAGAERTVPTQTIGKARSCNSLAGSLGPGNSLSPENHSCTENTPPKNFSSGMDSNAFPPTTLISIRIKG